MKQNISGGGPIFRIRKHERGTVTQYKGADGTPIFISLMTTDGSRELRHYTTDNFAEFKSMYDEAKSA